MKTLDDIQEKLIQNKEWIAKNYHVIQLGIFGSYQRGEQTETSDVDILVEFEPNFRFGLLTFCELENRLSELLGLKVDLVMKDSLKPKIGENILREIIYLWLREILKIIYKIF